MTKVRLVRIEAIRFDVIIYRGEHVARVHEQIATVAEGLVV